MPMFERRGSEDKAPRFVGSKAKESRESSEL